VSFKYHILIKGSIHKSELPALVMQSIFDCLLYLDKYLKVVAH